MPASASPSVTLLATARTFSSYDLGVTVTPALENTCSAYVPHGTSTAHVTTMSSGFARSARPVMPSGLPGAVMISSRFVANVTGSPAAPPPSVSLLMFASSADANTSAGAPSRSCLASSDDAAKLNVALAPGSASPNASPSSVNASVSDAAAKTVMSLPLGDDVAPASSSPPHDVAPSASTVQMHHSHRMSRQ